MSGLVLMPGTILTPILVAMVVLFAIAPYILLQRQSIRRYAIIDAFLWLPILVAISLDPRLTSEHLLGPIAAFVLVSRSVLFSSALRLEQAKTDRPDRWGPVAAAFFAGLVYLIIAAINLGWPIDGDEPYYLLMSESLVEDFDLDLANQFSNLEESATGRTDLEPQWGDQISDGSIRSHHEPLLGILIMPGALAGSRMVAVAVICLFGALLVWALLRWATEIGIDRPGRSLGFFGFAFGPPMIYYATRIWPEVPAAFCLVQALRALERRRTGWVFVWIAPLMLLKIRFIPIALTLLVIAAWYQRRESEDRVRLVHVASVGAVILIPLLLMVLSGRSMMGVHTVEELRPQSIVSYLRGAAGLLIDAQAGILFQAPILLIGAGALFRWKSLSRSLRAGLIASTPYLLLLLPRAEWHGGWSPPLRYLVVLLPLLALGVMLVEDRLPSWLRIAVVGWTAILVWTAVAWPWKTFHIANGESLAGEMLSRLFSADFSRLLPSLIRPDRAVWAWLVVALLMIAIAGFKRVRVVRGEWVALMAIVALGAAVMIGATPGTRIELEDAHVEKLGGELFPERWTVSRFLYSGGWTLEEGDGLRYRFGGGDSTLAYSSESGATLEVDGEALELPPATPSGYIRISPQPNDGYSEINVIRGRATLDWIQND